MRTTSPRPLLQKVRTCQCLSIVIILTRDITDQLQELRKVSLASILCENLDGVYMVQPDVFIGLDPFLNAPVTCDVFQRIDEKNIEPWKTDSPALQVKAKQYSKVGKKEMEMKKRENWVFTARMHCWMI